MIDSLLSYLDEPSNESELSINADSQRKKHNTLVEVTDGFQFIVFDDAKPDEQAEIRLTHILNFEASHLAKLKSQALNNEMVIERQESDLNNARRGSKLFNEGVKYGAQAGLKSTIDTFESAVKKMGYSMGQIYNFNSVMIGEGNIHPPVISMSKHLTSVNEEQDEFSYINTRYETIQQAKFLETPVSFMSYLNLSNQEIDLPSIYSIPLNEVELTYWANGVYEGWKRGQKLAEQELDNAINRLKRDWLGIKRYEALVKQRIISEPIVRTSNNDIEGYQNGMDVGIKILKIRTLPEYEANASKWNVLPMIDQLETHGRLKQN